MKNFQQTAVWRQLSWLLILIAGLNLSGCKVIGDIFDAWVGALVAIGIIISALWLLSRFFPRN